VYVLLRTRLVDLSKDCHVMTDIDDHRRRQSGAMGGTCFLLEPDTRVWCGASLRAFLNTSSAVAEIGNRLATTLHGRKVAELLRPFPWKAESPSNAIPPGPRPTSVPVGILIHPTVWPQYTNVTDRQDNGPVAYNESETSFPCNGRQNATKYLQLEALGQCIPPPRRVLPVPLSSETVWAADLFTCVNHFPYSVSPNSDESGKQYLYTDSDSDRRQNLIICSLAHCQPSLKISCKSVWKFLRKVANRQTTTNYVSSLAEVTNIYKYMHA